MPWFRAAPNGQNSGKLERQALSDEHYGSAAWNLPLTEADYFVIDIETSGFSPQTDLVLSVASLQTSWHSNEPDLEICHDLVGHADLSRVPQHIWPLTGLTPEILHGKPEWHDVLFNTLKRAQSRVWIAHHARHELAFLQKSTQDFWRFQLRPIVVDTALVAQALTGSSTVPVLEEVCSLFDVPLGARHRADEDVKMTAMVWMKEAKLCKALGLTTVGQVVEWTLAGQH